MASTDIEQFAADLHQDVLLRAGDEVNPTLREEAFVEHVLELLTERDETSGAEPCVFEARGTGRSAAAKLNGWALSGDGATLDLFVCRYFGTGKVESVTKPDARRHFELASSFLKRALGGWHTRMEESSSAFEVSRRIHEARDSLATVRLFVLSDGIVRALEAPDLSVEDIEIIPVVWDLEKLSRLRTGTRTLIELDFVNDYGGALRCIQTGDPLGEYRTFLAFMGGPLLARIYGLYGQRLLERNVRAFLQARGKVNRGLQRTIKEQPSRFLAYNNGLCCTAARVDVEVEHQGDARLRSVTDFQIVNGGQTTASVFHALKKEKISVDQVVVQMKLTVISDPSRVAEMVPLISQFANSQNKVNTADFSANGPFHQTVEQLSRAVWAPAASGIDRQTHWYYERARGSYADDRSAHTSLPRRREWERQNPPQQKFTKTDLAKFELAWMSMPHVVCLGAEKAFLRHAELLDETGIPVVDSTYFEHLVAKAILFKAAERAFSKQELKGYRAQSVAYTVAWLSWQSGRRIDLHRIWSQQHVSHDLVNALASVCRAAHEHITGQPGNASEAAKKGGCWDSFREKELDIDNAWRTCLADAPFVAAATEEDWLAGKWDTLRIPFAEDNRTMGDLEILTGKQWVSRRRRDAVRTYASMTWAELKRMPGLGPVKRRVLLELLATAAEG
ncbi:MAG: AIPR family protein [Polyangiaceae bacterium]